MREFKFRYWDDQNSSMTLFDITLAGGWIWDDLEIMQYTGLKDKNGKEIYEGDIVVIRQPHTTQFPYIIRYDDQIASFTMSHRRSGLPSVGIGGYYLQVIGNIYENPELLTN